jgi:hypothetical protein
MCFPPTSTSGSPADNRSWIGTLPIRNARRSRNDCAKDGLSPELLRQAAQVALRRGLVMKSELVGVETALEPFGGQGRVRRERGFELVLLTSLAEPRRIGRG